jgi:hypothetical protein
VIWLVALGWGTLVFAIVVLALAICYANRCPCGHPLVSHSEAGCLSRVFWEAKADGLIREHYCPCPLNPVEARENRRRGVTMEIYDQAGNGPLGTSLGPTADHTGSGVPPKPPPAPTPESMTRQRKPYRGPGPTCIGLSHPPTILDD